MFKRYFQPPIPVVIVVLCALISVFSIESTHAQNFTNDYTGTIVTDDITVSGDYTITAAGAAGGKGIAAGGKGALVSGMIYLTNGTLLDIAVGGVGGSGGEGGSGGGGTFVFISTNDPLLVAGGGGGGGGAAKFVGGSGWTNQTGEGGVGPGGSNGNGGSGGPFSSGGGAGFYSSGAGGAVGGMGAPSFAGGVGTASDGGFGGGGGSDASSQTGGGGGYSGGGGAGTGGAGGGGSFVDTIFTSTRLVTGGNTSSNNGFVSILADFPLYLFVGSNSTVAPTNFTSGTKNYLNTYVGYDPKASKNLLTVGGTETALINGDILTVGVAGSNNRMVITNGGTVSDVTGSIGSASSSLGNSVLVTGAGSSWSNSGTVTIGDAGSGTLTTANQGRVVATGGIIIAAQPSSSGTLGIGSLSSSAGSGTLTTPSITFGLGKGSILTTGVWQGGSNAILSGTPLFVDDPFQVALTNSTLNIALPLGGSTNSGSFTYTFNRSGSNFYEIATTNGQTLQPITDTTWDNTSTNWHANAGGPALVFSSSNNFLYNETFAVTGTLLVPTNGVKANQVTFIDLSDQNIAGGTINATSFLKSGQGLLIVSNNLSLIGSFSNTGAGSANLSGAILSGSITQGGTGTLTLTGSNSYGGGTILSGGTIALGNSSALGSASVYVEGNGTLSGSSTLTVDNAVSLLGKSLLTLNAAGISNSLTESGAIAGTGSLLKTGTGSVTLSGTNSFTGGTTVSQGTLAANSLGSGALLLKPGKGTEAEFDDTLGSAAIHLGAITLSGNSTLGIENPYGSILSSGAISITGTNNFIDLSGAWTNLGTYALLTGTKLTGSGLKKLDLTGSFLDGATLALGKSVTFDGLDYTFTNNSTSFDLTISSVTPKLHALSLNLPEFSSDGGSISIPNGGSTDLSIQAVPEPSAYALLGMGLGVIGMVFVTRWRSDKKTKFV